MRLRLKHRLIAASLVSKLNKIHSQRIKEFMLDKLNFEMENFQLDTLSKPEEKESTPKWEDLDLFALIENERLLYSTRDNELGPSTSELEDEKKVFDSFLDMNQATMLNIENSFKDVSLQNDVTEEAFQNEALKYKLKAEKINRKSQEQMESVELTICNPFNLMY